MVDKNQKSAAVNVTLRGGEQASHPALANYTTVGVAQGLVYLDFGFLEPAMLAAATRAGQNGDGSSKTLEGRVTTRVAMPLDSFLRLHQQIKSVIGGLRGKRNATNTPVPHVQQSK